jgi:hypothetical protein
MQLGILDKDTGEEIVKIGQMAGQSFDIELSVNYNYKQYFSEKTS